MKKLVIYIITLIIVAIFGYIYLDDIRNPCASPLSYRIGFIDERHNISEDVFTDLIKQSEAVWEKEFNRNLFQKTEDAKLVVNLIFDERQQKLNFIEQSEGKLDNQISKLEMQEKALEVQRLNYEQRLAKFNKVVLDWNTGPRTSQKTLNFIRREEVALKNVAGSLEKEVLSYNLAVEQYNANVQSFNHNIPDEEEAGVARGNKEINIFLLNNDKSDKYLVAHELGHAIGITGHATTFGSLMYYKLSDNPTNKLSPEDISLLNSACKF